MTETDSENREFAGKLLYVFNRNNVFLRVTRAVREHDSVGIHLDNFLSRSVIRKNRNLAAPCDKLTHNVLLCAVVEKRNPVFCSPIRHGIFFLTAYTLDRVNNPVSLYLVIVDIVRRADDFGVHNALFTDYSRNFTGVNSVNTDYPLLLEEGVEVVLRPEIGRQLAPLPDNIAADVGLVAFKVLLHNAVVADKGERLHNYLSVIAGVGERFDISAHTRCEDELAESLALCAEALAFKYVSVFKYNVNFFNHNVAAITAFIVCILFSASLKTIDLSLSKTSSVTSRASQPNLSPISLPTFVLWSW